MIIRQSEMGLMAIIMVFAIGSALYGLFLSQQMKELNMKFTMFYHLDLDLKILEKKFKDMVNQVSDQLADLYADIEELKQQREDKRDDFK